MNLEQRIALLSQLGEYLTSNNEDWQYVKDRAQNENGWFVSQFVNLAANNIAKAFLQKEKLEAWAAQYGLPAEQPAPKTVGLVMAGNIPLVGFHDFLSVFISGHKALIKPSSKDSLLIKHLVAKLTEWEPAVSQQVQFAEQLKGCDAYIATGSNNSGRYFDYYFRNYPSIIRKNRTSLAILDGTETPEQLDSLADDMLLYFGLGCRNVSKMYVPRGYDFVPLLRTLDKYKWMEDHHKLKNNYDYNLSLHILNHNYYMTNGVLLLVEKQEIFSPISQLNFEFYDDAPPANLETQHADELQCIIGNGYTPFGLAQQPGLTDYADGVDTLQFLRSL